MDKRRVLFLCTRNTARSQIAEALLKKYAGDKFEAYSAGLEPTEIHPYTYQTLNEIGVDISEHYPKPTTDLMGRMFFDYVIAVCRSTEPRCPTVYPDPRNFQRWLFDDPVEFAGSDEEKLAKFREVRDQIDQRLQLWISETTG
jgi:arsenate reductase (thioredoxin)